MNYVLVKPPASSRIVQRSMIRGAADGAATGAIVMLAVSLGAACAGSAAAYACLILIPIGAFAGTAIGMLSAGCGGLALAIFRRQVAASRTAIRQTFGLGAALPFAIGCLAGRHDPVIVRLVALALALLAYGLGCARGPAVFFGQRR